MAILELIKKHEESIRNGQYEVLEQALAQTQYDLNSLVFVDILKKLTELNSNSRIPVILAIVDCYLDNYSDRLSAYCSLSHLVNNSMQDSSLSSAERIALEMLD